MGGARPTYDGIVACSQTEFTEDLTGRFTRAASWDATAMTTRSLPTPTRPLSAKLVHTRHWLKTYKGFPHGMRPPRPRRSTPNCWPFFFFFFVFFFTASDRLGWPGGEMSSSGHTWRSSYVAPIR